ncbi:ribonucleoside-diphosphate reductase subunit alpha [Candidatus Parcubacteria bacterium]|nr:ribonucleoside-diphosphate reductase subunit alpha [Candidatus Parcubacteria bacterium]
MSISITKTDGTRVAFNADRINRSIERACKGLTNPIAMVTQIATETQLTLYDGITEEEMDFATINAAVQNIKEDIEYDRVATRLLLKTIYRKVVGDYDKDNPEELRQKHRNGFISYVKSGVANKRLHPDMIEKYDLDILANALKPERDELFKYAGIDGLMNRYGLKDMKQQPLETPQYIFMRIAMGLSYHEDNPTQWAIKFYNKMSKHEYLAGGSTNLGAGTVRPALSNCFLLEIHDNMEHIAKSVSDVMLLSKGSGGIGASVTKLRAAGSPLRKNFGGVSTGPTPYAKIIDTAIRAIQRGGKKKGALCFYMENWHLDFPEFIDWKHNAGDDYLRMRTANTAVFMSDEFMRRVQKGEDWYMFDPVETPDLNELYGQAFSARYREYTEMADAGKLRTYKRVPAQEQFRQILVAMQTTSHPWLTWKDTINLRALNNNTGTIHMSNLCTEICLPQDEENVAVCNLASLNLAAHVFNKEINWAKLEDSVRTAVRQLDNLIDINVLPIPEAEKSDKENRAIGLGIMGFSDTIEQLGMSYDSEHAWDFADRIFEFISYMAIDESANLAETRGSYSHFRGSGWSKGMVPIDSIKQVEEDRGRALTVAKESRHKGLNWDILRAKVRKGMRNATLMAVAPNANIGLVAGTTPGIDPRFAQVFSRNKISGKYLDLNHNLVKDLKNMGIWEKVREQIVENQGDISDINAIPQHIKDVYKTSFTTSPYAYIEVAARAQKWVDQALSRNMYLETRDIDETMRIYQTAWDKGLKTTYYLHMKPRHSAEQSTVAVNKSQKMGRVGFGAVRKQADIAPMSFASPLQKTIDMTPAVMDESAEVSSEPHVEENLGGLFEKAAPAASSSPLASATAHTTPVMTAPEIRTPAPAHTAEKKTQGFNQPKAQHQAPAALPKTKGFVSLENLKKNTHKNNQNNHKQGNNKQQHKHQPHQQNKSESKNTKPHIYRSASGPTDPADANICDDCQ